MTIRLAQSDKKEVNKNIKFDTYLTDMKELPPEETGLEKAPTQSKQAAKTEAPPLLKKENPIKPIIETPVKTFESEDDFIEEEEEQKPILGSKDIILGIVNLISVILLIIILVRLPSKASELSNLRKEEFRSKDITLNSPEYLEAKKKADELSKLFLDDSGIVNFVSDIEKIKNEGGAVTKLTFANQKALKDKTTNYGLPVILELSGNWEKLGESLQKIDSLPYLIRPITVDIQRSKDDPQVILYKYGVFLYVNTKLGENR